MTYRQRPGDQPLPTEGGENVQDRLIGMIEERRALGIARYGRPLQTFNGRDPLRDALEEVLDLASYLLQHQMEQEARQTGINAALALHPATGDLCGTCGTPSPCPTRRVLTPPYTVPARQLVTHVTYPIEEVAVHPDTLGTFKAHLALTDAERRLGASVSEYMGVPIVTDPGVEPGVVRLRPSNYAEPLTPRGES